MRSLAIAFGLLALGAPPAMAADPAHPTVLELFQSQGCSDCPPANANLNAVADRPDVLALSFGVTYWDQLGWKDTFAQPAFTARQWDYAHAGGRAQVFTPQMIVNGRGVLVGADRAQVEAALQKYDRGAGGPAMSLADGKVLIGAGMAKAPATIWLVRYDPRVQNVPIRAGENGGRTLPHRNIVRSLQRLGRWTGAPLALDISPSATPALRTAVLVQEGKAGPIVAALRL